MNSPSWLVASTIKNQNKPTQKELFEQIYFNNCYPSRDKNNQLYWIPSQELQGQLNFIEYLELAEKFVEKVVKSTDLPFTIVKSLKGPPRLIEKSPLEGLFYQLIGLQHGNLLYEKNVGWLFSSLYEFLSLYFDRVISHYEGSEYVKILVSTATDMLMGSSAIFTGNPLFRMNSDGLLEGELINSFAFRLREAAKGKKFKNGLTERKKIALQNFNLSKHYLERLYAHQPSLFASYLFLHYSSLLRSITLIDSDTHLKRLLILLHEDVAQKQIVGWWWKKEYMTAVGFHYRLIIFADRKKIYSSSDIMDTYAKRWAEATDDKGHCCNALTPEREWFCPDENGIYQPPQPINNLPSILRIMNRMLMCDIYMKLSNPHLLHFGMGPLPKPADPVLSDNSNSPDSFNSQGKLPI